MSKRTTGPLILIIISTIFPILCPGIEYIPFTTEGRMWVLSNEPIHIHNYFTPTIVATVGNDTIIDGKNCVNIDITSLSLDGISKGKETLYEDNGSLWWWKESCKKFILLMDMSAEKGNFISTYDGDGTGETLGSMYVKTEEYIELWGLQRKVLGIYDETGNNLLTYWIEGVGSTNDIYQAQFNVHLGDSTYLTQLFDNSGWLCFSLREFEKKILELHQTEAADLLYDNQDDSSVIYDLNGLVISEPMKGNIYIKNRSLHIKD